MNLAKSGLASCKQRQQTVAYNKYDRRPTEQFIHGLDDEGMISEILREVSMVEDSNNTTSEWVLLWPKG